MQGGGVRTLTTKYIKFRGNDMTTDPSKVDNSRSPYAPNLVSDSGGYPEKRAGYRTLQSVEKPINGLFELVIKDKTYFIAHGGTKLYLWSDTTAPTVIKSDINNAKSKAVTLCGKLWILTGREYLVFDGATVKNVLDDAYTPTIIIARAPSGGGTPYEKVNLLQPKRINSFLADGTAKEYQLSSTNLDATALTVVVNERTLTEGVDYSVNRATGKVTFVTAPAKPTLTGQDNVIITFSKTVSDYASRILNCNIVTLFGVGSNDRLFVSGNAQNRSTDYYSEMNNPTYFPDLNYSIIGSENTSIMGYAKINEQLAIIKEDNSQDSTIFLRTAKLETDADGNLNAIFPIKQGVIGIGAISKYGFANLLDEPMFLSRTGIYAITSNSVNSEKTVQNRSFYVDALLTKEKNLNTAVAVEWNGRLLVAVNGNCYLLDGTQDKSYKPQSNGAYVYECFYWNNIFATCFMEHKGALYFGTADGDINKFNTDIVGSAKYNDNGAPIDASWSTKADDDGDFMSLKTIVKNGTGVMLKPLANSTCDLYIKSDSGKQILLQSVSNSFFSFNNINFVNSFSFQTTDQIKVIPIRQKLKNYTTAQFILRNNNVNQNMGVLGIVKRYYVNKYRR